MPNSESGSSALSDPVMRYCPYISPKAIYHLYLIQVQARESMASQVLGSATLQALESAKLQAPALRALEYLQSGNKLDPGAGCGSRQQFRIGGGGGTTELALGGLVYNNVRPSLTE